MNRDDFLSMLGEGFHTAFRKAGDSATATQVHRLIGNLAPEEWSSIVEFVADGFGVTFPGIFDPTPAPEPTAAPVRPRAVIDGEDVEDIARRYVDGHATHISRSAVAALLDRLDRRDGCHMRHVELETAVARAGQALDAVVLLAGRPHAGRPTTEDPQ